MQSTYEFIKFGVPQGSVLGPQTFVPLHCRSCAAHRRTSSARRRHHIPDRDVQVEHDCVHPVQSAGDLGVYVDDGGVTMRAHINHVLSCYGTMRQFRSITRSLPSHALHTLVTGLVHSRLDYCNVVFAGLPVCVVQRLQSVFNTAVRLVAGSSRRNNVTSLLRDRHGLPVKRRVEYKLCKSTSLFVRRRTILFNRSHTPRLLLQVPEPV